MVREGLPEKLTFEQRPAEGGGYLERNIADRGQQVQRTGSLLDLHEQVVRGSETGSGGSCGVLLASVTNWTFPLKEMGSRRSGRGS